MLWSAAVVVVVTQQCDGDRFGLKCLCVSCSNLTLNVTLVIHLPTHSLSGPGIIFSAVNPTPLKQASLLYLGSIVLVTDFLILSVVLCLIKTPLNQLWTVWRSVSYSALRINHCFRDVITSLLKHSCPLLVKEGSTVEFSWWISCLTAASYLTSGQSQTNYTILFTVKLPLQHVRTSQM